MTSAPHRTALLQVQSQVQAHLALLAALPPPQTPIHARQSLKQTAVLHPPGPPARAFQPRRRNQLPAQLREDFRQQGGIQQGLGLRKTAQTHWSAADVLLHSCQMAGRAQAAHRAHHRIEQAQQQQAQVIAAGQPSCPLRPSGRERMLVRRPAQTLLKILDQPPAGEVALRPCKFRWRPRRHVAIRPKNGKKYK